MSGQLSVELFGQALNIWNGMSSYVIIYQRKFIIALAYKVQITEKSICGIGIKILWDRLLFDGDTKKDRFSSKLNDSFGRKIRIPDSIEFIIPFV